MDNLVTPNCTQTPGWAQPNVRGCVGAERSHGAWRNMGALFRATGVRQLELDAKPRRPTFFVWVSGDGA